jgi:hypothetical protein
VAAGAPQVRPLAVRRPLHGAHVGGGSGCGQQQQQQQQQQAVTKVWSSLQVVDTSCNKSLYKLTSWKLEVGSELPFSIFDSLLKTEKNVSKSSRITHHALSLSLSLSPILQ